MHVNVETIFVKDTVKRKHDDVDEALQSAEKHLCGGGQMEESASDTGIT